MKRRLLYYPLADPPPEVALQAALYWDELITLGPPHHAHDTPLLQAMQAADLLTSATPDSYFDELHSLAALAEISAVVESLSGKNRQPDASVLDPSNRIFSGKLPHVIESELLERGLLAPATEEAYRSSRLIQQVILSVISRRLAAVLDQADPTTSTSIFTDSERLLNQAVGALPRNEVPAWRIEVGSRLPLPAPDTDPEHILRFRDEYAAERHALHTAVTKLASSLTTPEGVDLPALFSELDAAEQNVARASRSRGIRLVRGGFSLVAGLGAAAALSVTGAPDVAQSVGGLTASLFADNGMSVLLGAARSEHSDGFAYLADVRSTFPGPGR